MDIKNSIKDAIDPKRIVDDLKGLADEVKEVAKKYEYPRYMMATKAMHMLGDISRETPDLCFIEKEEGENYVGSWVEGHGFFNVKFPKETTRELTEEEKDKYNGMQIQIGGNPLFIIKMRENPVSKSSIIVRTRNSIYRFGSDAGNGVRTVSRDGNPLGFAQCKINFLAEGKSMMFYAIDKPGLCVSTSRVLSIE
jgi:hypothetical protein